MTYAPARPGDATPPPRRTRDTANSPDARSQGGRSRRARRGRRGVVRNVPLRTHWLLLTVLDRHARCRPCSSRATPSTCSASATTPPAPAAGPAGRVPAAGRPRRPGDRQRSRAAPHRPPHAPHHRPDLRRRPRPAWTPQILDVLRRHHVHATFFVVGTQVAAHPALVRQILADGNQIGIHTFTHADLGTIPGLAALPGTARGPTRPGRSHRADQLAAAPAVLLGQRRPGRPRLGRGPHGRRRTAT